MGAAVLTIRFLCELAALAALAWWGQTIAGPALAIALPAAAATLWGLWIAPRAKHRLADPLRLATETIVWGGATASLIGVGHLPIAIAFAVVALGTAIAARRYEPAAVSGASG